MKCTFWSSHSPHTHSVVFLTCPEAVAPLQNSIWKAEGAPVQKECLAPAVQPTFFVELFKVSAEREPSGSTSTFVLHIHAENLLLPLSLPLFSLRHAGQNATQIHQIAQRLLTRKATLSLYSNMCVKLDPKFEKHYREACLHTHWVNISTLFKFGPDRGFVHTTYVCTHTVPQIFRKAAQFDETRPGNVSNDSRMSIK